MGSLVDDNEYRKPTTKGIEWCDRIGQVTDGVRIGRGDVVSFFGCEKLSLILR